METLHYELLDLILHHLAIADIKNLSLCSKSLRDSIKRTHFYEKLIYIIKAYPVKICASKTLDMTIELVSYMAEHESNLEFFKQLKCMGLHDKVNDNIGLIFALNNDMESLQFLYSEGFPIKAASYIGIMAAKNNNLQMLDFAFRIGCKPDWSILHLARSHSNHPMIDLAIRYGCH